MDKSKKIRLYYGIFLAALTIVTGFIFIIQVADLYYSSIAVDPAAPPYTLESVRSHALVPIIFLCIWAAAAIAGFVLSVVFPAVEDKKRKIDSGRVLNNLKCRIPSKKGRDGYVEAMNEVSRYENNRFYLWSLTFGVLLSGAICIVVYAFNPQNFHASAFKSDIMELVRNIIVWIVLGIVCILIASIYEGISYQRELDYVKRAIMTGDRTSKPAKIRRNFYIGTLIALSVVTLSFIVVYAVSPSMYTGILGSIGSDKAAPLTFSLFAVIVALAVFSAVYAFRAKVDRGIDEKKRTVFATVVAAVISGLTVVLYIVAPSALNGIMNNLESSKIVFIAFAALILIVSAIALMSALRRYVPEKADKIMLICTRAAVGIVAVSFIIAGALNGGAGEMFTKAIKICTECIGLG